jgi:hypothetical protein
MLATSQMPNASKATAAIPLMRSADSADMGAMQTSAARNGTESNTNGKKEGIAANLSGAEAGLYPA